MIRRPPRSTLFPSTPLSRSVIAAPGAGYATGGGAGGGRGGRAWTLSRGAVRYLGGPGREQTFTFDTLRTTVLQETPTRSEEHTSELQSRLHLVCRLLLEKKKKNKGPRGQLDADERPPGPSARARPDAG